MRKGGRRVAGEGVEDTRIEKTRGGGGGGLKKKNAKKCSSVKKEMVHIAEQVT
jgi:hypothetical protein